jgi:hypothetical protein
MGQNLTGQTIASTYEDLVQISGSVFTDGLGNDITSATITASNAISSSYALTASFALNAGGADTGSLMVTGSVNLNTLTFTKGDGSTFNLTVDTGSAVTVDTGSLMITGSVSLNTLTFTKGDGSTFDLTVDTGSAVTVDTGSLLVTASISDATTTYTKGDGSTFALVTNNVNNAVSASIATTASAVDTTPASDNVEYDLVFVADSTAGTQEVKTDDNANITFNPSTGVLSVPTLDGNALTATSASFAQTASFALNAATASFVNLGTSAAAGFTGSTWIFTHNLDKPYVVIDCYDANEEEIIPQTIDLTTSNQATITFPVSVQGTAVASLGNGVTAGVSPISTYSSGVAQGKTVYTQKLDVDTAAIYNIHISASGCHWIDATNLASGTGASVNAYWYPESLTNVGDQAFVIFSANSGSATAITYRALTSASAGFEYTSAGTSIGNSNQTITRNASLVIDKALGSNPIVPTIMTRTVDGVALSGNLNPLGNINYRYVGSQGTPL